MMKLMSILSEPELPGVVYLPSLSEFADLFPATKETSGAREIGDVWAGTDRNLSLATKETSIVDGYEHAHLWGMDPKQLPKEIIDRLTESLDDKNLSLAAKQTSIADAAYEAYLRDPSGARPLDELMAEWEASDAKNVSLLSVNGEPVESHTFIYQTPWPTERIHEAFRAKNMAFLDEQEVVDLMLVMQRDFDQLLSQALYDNHQWEIAKERDENTHR